MRPSAKMLHGQKTTPPRVDKKPSNESALQKLYLERKQTEDSLRRLSDLADNDAAATVTKAAQEALKRAVGERQTISREKVSDALARSEKTLQKYQASLKEQSAALKARLRAIDLQIEAEGGPATHAERPPPGKKTLLLPKLKNLPNHLVPPDLAVGGFRPSKPGPAPKPEKPAQPVEPFSPPNAKPK
ncbi:MAG: DUF2066 domain-containing protein [Polyangiaceae bacterium]|nr:DUF2066 domain-containing protein [Polyangiaceae bacterium]